MEGWTRARERAGAARGKPPRGPPRRSAFKIRGCAVVASCGFFPRARADALPTHREPGRPRGGVRRGGAHRHPARGRGAPVAAREVCGAGPRRDRAQISRPPPPFSNPGAQAAKEMGPIQSSQHRARRTAQTSFCTRHALGQSCSPVKQKSRTVCSVHHLAFFFGTGAPLLSKRN